MINEKLLERKKQILFITSASCVFVLIFILNKFYPLFSDDWYYSFIYESNQNQHIRITSFSQIIESQYNHYLLWGGRSVVHTIDQLLLMTNFSVICLLNSLVYLIFVFTLYKISNKGNKINPSVFIILSLLVWFSQPTFFEVILWKTGSVNYLWGGLILILFMYPYYADFRSMKYQDSLLKTLLFFFCGIIAGWTNENMSIALIFFILSILIASYYKKKTIPKWAIAGLIGVIIGCAFLLLAPGNYVRIQEVKTTYGWHDFSFIKMLGIIINRTLKYFLYYILPLLGIYLLLVFIYNKYPKEAKNFKLNIYSSLLFIVAGIVAFGVTIASFVFPERSLFGIIFLFTIAIGIIYANIDFKYSYIRYLNIAVIVILLLFFCKGYYQASRDLYTVSTAFNERESYIEEQKKLGIDSIVFTKALDPISEQYSIWDLTDNPKGWTNKGYALFHELKSVTLVIDKKEAK